MCRKQRLIDKYGEALVEILHQGEIMCPDCRVVHSKGIDYLFETGEEKQSVEENWVQ